MNLLSVNKHLFFRFKYFYDPNNGKISHSVILPEHLESRYIAPRQSTLPPSKKLATALPYWVLLCCLYTPLSLYAEWHITILV